jgi:RNA polymerase sigma factor (sigma-70 family)
MTPILMLKPLSVQSDARLVELARGGSEPAFEALVRRYRRPLLAYARRLVGVDGRAEDALQQALMGAWLALRDGAEVDEVRPWLHRIVHNSAVTMLRRAQHETVELNEALDAASDGGPESRLAIGELLAGLAALPEPQRRALLLTAISGRSHLEAAATLGLTDGAVRGLVYRARASLRRAAAALLPIGPLNWLVGSVTRRPMVAQTAEATGAASSAGVAAAVLKGGAIVAGAGVIAGAGPVLLPGPATHHHNRARTATRQVQRRAPGHPPLGAARVLVVDRLGGADHGRSGAGPSRSEGRDPRESGVALRSGDGRRVDWQVGSDNHGDGRERSSASGDGRSGSRRSDGGEPDHGTVSGSPVSDGDGSPGGGSGASGSGSEPSPGSSSSGGGTDSSGASGDTSTTAGTSATSASGKESTSGSGDTSTSGGSGDTNTSGGSGDTSTTSTTTSTSTETSTSDGATNPPSGSAAQPAGVPAVPADG